MKSDSLDLYKHKCDSRTEKQAPSAPKERRAPCGKRCVSRIVERAGEMVREYRRVMCKKWRCLVCGPKKRKALAWAIGQAVERHGLVAMMTLTLDPAKLPAGVDTCKYIKKTWAKFRKPIERLLGRSIGFIWVLELQKNERAHLHVLIDSYLPQSWVSKKWARYGGGRIVDIRKIDSAKAAAWYVSKYLAKSCDGRLPDRERRYGKSRNIQLFEQAEKGEWELVPWGFEAIRQHRNEMILETEYDEFGNPIIFRAERELDYDPERAYPPTPF